MWCQAVKTQVSLPIPALMRAFNDSTRPLPTTGFRGLAQTNVVYH